MKHDISRQQTECEPKDHLDIYTCLYLIIMVITADTNLRSEIELRLAASAPGPRHLRPLAFVNGGPATENVVRDESVCYFRCREIWNFQKFCIVAANTDVSLP